MIELKPLFKLGQVVATPGALEARPSAKPANSRGSFWPGTSKVNGATWTTRTAA
jgi:hypothetical protein